MSRHFSPYACCHFQKWCAISLEALFNFKSGVQQACPARHLRAVTARYPSAPHRPASTKAIGSTRRERAEFSPGGIVRVSGEPRAAVRGKDAADRDADVHL